MTALFEPLANIIRENIIAAGGSISFSRYMELALYHPLGYYLREDFAIGQHGDFTTAPEISPLFAQCIAQQSCAIAQQIETNSILEIGAGTGKFASDFLNKCAAMGELPQQYYIYDISPVLRKKQYHYLRTHCSEHLNRIVWLDQLPKNFMGVIIANEVLDALPVHCFQIEKNQAYERVVCLEGTGFGWQLTPAAGKLYDAIEQIRDECYLQEGYQSEINLRLIDLIQSLADSLSHGVLLLIDYGYGRREYYHPERSKGTLTCFYQHRRHDNPLLLPGLQDITAHVDFTAAAEAASAAGFDVAGFTTQAAFLLASGLLSLAAEHEKPLTVAERFKLHQGIKQLTLPTEMGDRIKIMGLSMGCEPMIAGLSKLNRLRDL